MGDHDDIDGFDPAEVVAAEAGDAAVDRLLAGRPGGADDPLLAMIAAAVRVDPPPSLHRRVVADAQATARRREAAMWRPFRYAAGVLAYLLVAQALGNLLWGDWVADGVGDGYSPHAMREGAFALIAVGVVLAAAAVWRRFAPVAVAAGVPLAAALGVGGITEIGHFAPGAVLHLAEGAAGVAVAVTFVRLRRYGRDADDE